MPTPHLTVWYNTCCPVCNGGIDWQRNKLLAAVRAGEIIFKDINSRTRSPISVRRSTTCAAACTQRMRTKT